MKSASTGTISGCILWVIVFALLGMCLVPIAVALGGVTSVSDFAVRTTGGFICPDGSAPELYSYATTTTDEFGNRQPSTASVLQCVDTGGNVVKEDPVLYAFIWIGILAVAGLLLAGMLAFALAAPAGMLIARFSRRKGNAGASSYRTEA